MEAGVWIEFIFLFLFVLKSELPSVVQHFPLLPFLFFFFGFSLE